MRNPRHALSTMVITAAVLMPASTVGASADMNDTIRQLAADAAELAAEEQALLAMSVPGSTATDAELAQLRSKLASVDAQGVAALRVLEQLDVELTSAIRVALDRLPLPESRGPQGTAIGPPDGVVYTAAIADLNRINTTPDSVLSGSDDSPRPAIGLLVVSALALLALGAAALAGTTERRPEEDELTAMAWSDGLTGLGNRRRLDRDLGECRRLTGHTAVIMVDVDHFKSVNDNFGHRKGDEVLRGIGSMLSNQIRRDDIVYRYGGEEFCILLPESTVADARKVADRIVDAAHQIRLPDGQHITVSVGVADSVAGDVHRAVESADLALFRAKDLGRDQVVTAEALVHTGA